MRSSFLVDLRSLWVVRGYPLFIVFKVIVMSSAWINTTLMMPVLIFRFEATPSQIALITVLTGAPFILLAPYLGALADRRSPIAMMIGGALYRAATLTALAFAPSLEIFAAIMVINAVGSSANVADPVILRRLLTDSQIVTAIGVRGLLDQSTKLIAPLIGAGLILTVSSQKAFLFTALMSLASAGCMVLLGRQVGMLSPDSSSSKKVNQSNIRALMELLATSPVIRATAILTIGCCITMGMHASVLLFLLREQSLPDTAFGIHMSCTAVGGIAASLFFKTWIIGRDQVKIIYWCMMGFCTCILLTGAWGLSGMPISLQLIAPVWALSGFFFGGKVICYMVTLQTRSPKDKVGLVTASMQSVIMLIFETSPLIALAITHWESAALAYVVSAVLGMLFLLPLSIVRPPFVALPTAEAPTAENK